ncbi:unnamed protein product [Phyllotreta striolata]|uniref:Uncharacterized protein n=1 Tax=Phyllotreta striolata TaxID=444603 RepID=A0A9N9TXJ6_PHYSR|nr:unnamed protein product [Phyllotreta striolata]
MRLFILAFIATISAKTPGGFTIDGEALEGVREIGEDVENFVVDVAKEALKLGVFNVDYQQEPEENSSSNTISKSDEYTRKKRDTPANCRPDRLEQQQIEEIQREVAQLNQLLGIVNDQQDVLSMLDRNGGIPAGTDPAVLLKVLEHINNNLDEGGADAALPTYKKLENLKYDLQEISARLNRTKAVFEQQKVQEAALQVELAQQKRQTARLNKLIDKIVKKDEDGIVGAPKSEPNGTQPRTSSLSDLLDESDKPKTRDLKSDLAEFLTKLDQKDNNKDTPSDQGKPTSRGFTEDDVVFLKKLIEQNKLSDKPEGKANNDIEEELKRLEVAINKLKPSPGLNVVDIPSGKEDYKGSGVTLTTDQIVDLRRKLDEIINMQAKKDIKNILSIGESTHVSDDRKGLYPFGNPFWYPQNIPPVTPPLDYSYLPSMYNPFYPPFMYPPVNPNKGYYQPSYESFETPPYAEPPALEEETKGQDPRETPAERNAEEGPIDRGAAVSDIKEQIADLTKVIESMKNEAKLGTFGYNPILNVLEKEVSDLKGIINKLTEGNEPNQVAQNPPRIRRSLEIKPQPAKIDDVAEEMRKYLEPVQTKIPEETKQTKQTAQYDEVVKKINALKTRLGLPPIARAGDSYKPPGNYNQGYGTNNNLIPKPLVPITPVIPQQNDLLSDIIVKALDKIIAIMPKIFAKLFGDSLEGLVDTVTYDKTYYYNNNDNNNYGVSYDNNNNNNLLAVFYKMGAFGYVPLIVLKLLGACSTFLRILKSNPFYRNFLVPGLVLLMVSGAVVFLIWWLKIDEDGSMMTTRQIETSDTRLNLDRYNRYRFLYPGTDYYYRNYGNYYYPGNFYPYHSKSKDADGGKVLDDVKPGGYFRSYFETDSRKKVD